MRCAQPQALMAGREAIRRALVAAVPLGPWAAYHYAAAARALALACGPGPRLAPVR